MQVFNIDGCSFVAATFGPQKEFRRTEWEHRKHIRQRKWGPRAAQTPRTQGPRRGLSTRTPGAHLDDHDHRQVFWLTGPGPTSAIRSSTQPPNCAFSVRARLRLCNPQLEANGFGAAGRSRSQRRVHGGFAPPSLNASPKRGTCDRPIFNCPPRMPCCFARHRLRNQMLTRQPAR